MRKIIANFATGNRNLTDVGLDKTKNLINKLNNVNFINCYRYRFHHRLSVHCHRECDKNQQGSYCAAHVRSVLDPVYD